MRKQIDGCGFSRAEGRAHVFRPQRAEFDAVLRHGLGVTRDVDYFAESGLHAERVENFFV